MTGAADQPLEQRSQNPPTRTKKSPVWPAVNPADADMHGFAADSGVACGEMDASFAVRLDPQMQRGFAGVGVGLAGAAGALPAEAVQLEADPSYQPPPKRPATVIAKG